MQSIKALFMSSRERKKSKARLEVYGAMVMIHTIRDTCNADRCATNKVTSSLRKVVPVEDVKLYAEILTGAGYEW